MIRPCFFWSFLHGLHGQKQNASMNPWRNLKYTNYWLLLYYFEHLSVLWILFIYICSLRYKIVWQKALNFVDDKSNKIFVFWSPSENRQSFSNFLPLSYNMTSSIFLWYIPSCYKIWSNEQLTINYGDINHMTKPVASIKLNKAMFPRRNNLIVDQKMISRCFFMHNNWEILGRNYWILCDLVIINLYLCSTIWQLTVKVLNVGVVTMKRLDCVPRKLNITATD
jgi:hypothetical protein